MDAKDKIIAEQAARIEAQAKRIIELESLLQTQS
jgi:hypothetical protein